MSGSGIVLFSGLFALVVFGLLALGFIALVLWLIRKFFR